MKNKIALVTGANAGMGLATTIELAKQGYHVIMACRNKERGTKALEEAREESGSEQIECMICDLGSLESIRAFATAFQAKFNRLDVLINNAGVVSIRRETTSDGFESMMGVNHLGHFLLTNLLLDGIKAAEQGRIVVLSSGAHKIGQIYFDDPTLLKAFNVIKGYGQSKLANVLFTKELSKRLEGTNVTVNAVHPGAVATSLGVNRQTGFGKTVYKILTPFFQTPAEGASTAIYLATSPEVQNITGEYFYKKKISAISKRAKNILLAGRLWKWSERQVGLEKRLDFEELSEQGFQL